MDVTAPGMDVIATAGHVDHGKSTLVRALTGMEPDRWEEERRRGLTIDLGFAWKTLPSGRRLAVVDVPGHERFVGNMLAGVGSVPAAPVGWLPRGAGNGSPGSPSYCAGLLSSRESYRCRHWSPTRSCSSRTTHGTPARPRKYAVARPVWPAPMITVPRRSGRTAASGAALSERSVSVMSCLLALPVRRR